MCKASSRRKSSPSTPRRALRLSNRLLVSIWRGGSTVTRLSLRNVDTAWLGGVRRVEQLACLGRCSSGGRLLVARSWLAISAARTASSAAATALPSDRLARRVAARVLRRRGGRRAKYPLACFGVLALFFRSFLLRTRFALFKVGGGLLLALFFAVVVEGHTGHVAGEDLRGGLAGQHCDFGLEGRCDGGSAVGFGVPLGLWVLAVGGRVLVSAVE